MGQHDSHMHKSIALKKSLFYHQKLKHDVSIINLMIKRMTRSCVIVHKKTETKKERQTETKTKSKARINMQRCCKSGRVWYQNNFLSIFALHVSHFLIVVLHTTVWSYEVSKVVLTFGTPSIRLKHHCHLP